jgi:hypothetical protein
LELSSKSEKQAARDRLMYEEREEGWKAKENEMLQGVYVYMFLCCTVYVYMYV